VCFSLMTTFAQHRVSVLCEWHSQGYDCTHACCVFFSLTGIDTAIFSQCKCGVFCAFSLICLFALLQWDDFLLFSLDGCSFIFCNILGGMSMCNWLLSLVLML
jgi:hypothetical protein